MIIEPKKNEEHKQLLNCYDNWTVWQRIMFMPPNPSERENPYGLPLECVGKFILCCRRYSNWGTPQCMTCRKETNDWANNIQGDRKKAELVGGFIAFINKKLSAKDGMFVIRTEDIIIKDKNEAKQEEILP